MATIPKRTSATLHLLSARQVLDAGEGDHSDGGGLTLRVRGESCAWVLRFAGASGRRREMASVSRTAEASSASAGCSRVRYVESSEADFLDDLHLLPPWMVKEENPYAIEQEVRAMWAAVRPGEGSKVRRSSSWPRP